MKSKSILLLAAAILPTASQAAPLAITATNKLPFARASQTIELTAAQLAALGKANLDTVHITDAAGKELVTQAVDTDGDRYRKPDLVIFQSDFAANESKSFTASVGKKQIYSKDQYKAYGRFVRERFDDFAWENDRIAHRTYGKALEIWEGEPLASSTIDIWCKRSPRLVINDWYLTGDYHEDHGEGADFYSAGPTRGCGGNGLWAADKLWTSRNFIGSNLLANGPIRVLFELTYEPFDVNGVSVAEVKRVSLDSGSQLDRYESIYKQYTLPGQKRKLTTGIGLKKSAGGKMETDAGEGWMTVWEKVDKNSGNQGLAIIVDPKQWVKDAGNGLNHLVLAATGPNDSISYHAGFCWDKAGHITTPAEWTNYVKEFVKGLASPIEIEIAPAAR